MLGCIFPGGGRPSKACADDGILVKYIFAIKASECSKRLEVYFHSYSQTEKYVGMISPSHSGKLKDAAI